MITFDNEPIEQVMSAAQMQEINAMDYFDLLWAWRFHPIGHHLFQGETGRYFSKALTRARDQLRAADCAAISQRVGFSTLVEK